MDQRSQGLSASSSPVHATQLHPSVPNEQLRALIDHMPIVLWILDSEGVFTLSEGKELAALGLSAGEVVGRSVFEIYAEFPSILEDARLALAGEERSSVERVGGIWFETRCVPLRDSEGGVVGMLGIALNVTDRLDAQQELTASLSLLQAAIESTADGILVVDCDGRILTQNRKMGELWQIPDEVLAGARDEGLIGFVLDQLVDPDAFVERVQQLYASPEAESFDVVEFKDGRVFERYSQPQRIGTEVVGRVWSFRDATQRRRAEDELRRREAQLARTQELAGLGSWEWEVGADEVSWSDELYRIYGLAPQSIEITLHGFLERVHPEDRAMVGGTVQRSLETAQPFSFEHRVLRPDGSIRWIFGLGEVITGPGGEVQRLHGTGQDITDRKAASEALRASENRFRTLFEQFPFSIQIFSPEGLTLEVNRAWSDFFGLTPEQVRDFNALTAEQLSAIAPFIRRAFEGEPTVVPPTPFDLRLFAADSGQSRGEGQEGLRWVQAYLSPVVEEEGRVKEVFVVHHDVTREREAEEVLRRSNEELEGAVEARTSELARTNAALEEQISERLRAEEELRGKSSQLEAIFRALPDSYVRLTNDGTIIESRAGTEADRSLWPDATMGRPLEAILPEHAARAFRAAIAEVREIGRAHLEYSTTIDGDERDLEARLVPLSSDETIAIIRDITERKAFEEALRAAIGEAESARETAEEANRAKSEFLSRMSHELRTPLNSILGFAQVVARRDIPHDQRKAIDHILKAGRHLLNLINEVLDIARIEATPQALSLEPVDVQQVVQEARMLIQPMAAERGCRVLDVRVERDRYVRADRQRLTQVLLNLLSNAIKYNRPGGEVSLVCEVGEGSIPSVRHLRVSVSDTGEGIPPHRMNDLFTPFARLGAEESGVEGTGLGLALSQRLVHAMGGTLTARSTVGQGSTFTVELPLVRSPLNSWADSSRSDSSRQGTPRADRAAVLLYIEDNLANLALIETVLDLRPEVTLLSALQGQVGAEMARKHRPDLILLDLHLPDMPGAQVLRRLQEQPETRDIPVLVVSADATPDTIQRLREQGAQGYLTKPIDVDQLLESVDRILTDRAPLQ